MTTAQSQLHSKFLLIFLFAPRSLQVVVFSVKNDHFHFLGASDFVDFDLLNASPNQLLDQADNLISSLLSQVKNPHIKQVLLCLPSLWLNEQGRIDNPYNTIFNDLLKSLDFTPLGFVTYSEVFSSYFKDKDGTPLNALFLALFPYTNIFVLLKSSQPVLTQEFTDFDDLSHQLSSLSLPPRILIYYTKAKKSLLATFLTQSWEETLSFLHLPTSDALSHHFFLSALAKILAKKLVPSSPSSSHSSSASSPFIKEHDIKRPPSTSKSKFSFPSLSLPHLPSFSFSSFSFPKSHFSFSISSKLFLLLLPFFLFIPLIYLLFFYLAKAQINLYFSYKEFTTPFTFHLSTQLQQPDLTTYTLPAQLLHLTDTLTKQASSSGTKLVGTPATGQVTIYNRTSLPKTFPKGTSLSADNLIFTLQDQVTIASQSADANYVETPGQAQATIQATHIGPQYNLPAGTEFQVASYSTSSFVAKNSQPLSGGTAQKVAVVSSQDVAQLSQQIFQEFATTMEQKLSASQSADTRLFLLPNSLAITSKQVNPPLESQADTFSLTLTLSAQALAYSSQDLQNLAIHYLNQHVPSQYDFTRPLKINLLNESTTSGKNQVTLKAKLTTSLIPKIDLPTLQHQLAGKKLSSLSTHLSSISDLTNTEFVFYPSFLRIFHLFPFNPQHITIKLFPHAQQ